MQKYQYMAVTNQIRNYDSLLSALQTQFDKADFLKSNYLMFEGKVMYFKLNPKNQEKFFHFYLTNVGFKLDIYNKANKQLIDTVTYNFNNSTDTSITTIFIKKFLPTMANIAKSSTPKAVVETE